MPRPTELTGTGVLTVNGRAFPDIRYRLAVTSSATGARKATGTITGRTFAIERAANEGAGDLWLKPTESIYVRIAKEVTAAGTEESAFIPSRQVERGV